MEGQAARRFPCLNMHPDLASARCRNRERRARPFVRACKPALHPPGGNLEFSGPVFWHSHRIAASRGQSRSQRKERIMNATTTVKGVWDDSDANRLRYLRIVLVAVGLIFTFGIYPLSAVWPSGWSWGHGHSHYLMMILGVYATLGVFLLIASRNPAAHTSLIWFTVGSCIVHAGIMAAQP